MHDEDNIAIVLNFAFARETTAFGSGSRTIPLSWIRLVIERMSKKTEAKRPPPVNGQALVKHVTVKGQRMVMLPEEEYDRLLQRADGGDHCSFYPMTGHTVEAFRDDLKDFKTSKGAICFQPDKPLPAALVKKLVKARVAEVEQRSSKSRRK